MLKLFSFGVLLITGLFFHTAAYAENPPVTFPGGWRVSKVKEGNIITWLAQAQSIKDFSVTISAALMTNKIHRKLDLSAELDGAVSGYKKGLAEEGVKAIITCGEKNKLTGDQTSAVATTCYAIGLGKLTFVMVQNKELAYLLTFFAENESFYDIFLPDWQKVLESAKLK